VPLPALLQVQQLDLVLCRTAGVAVVRLATGLGPRVAGLSAPQVPLALVPLLRPLVVVVVVEQAVEQVVDTASTHPILQHTSNNSTRNSTSNSTSNSSSTPVRCLRSRRSPAQRCWAQLVELQAAASQPRRRHKMVRMFHSCRLHLMAVLALALALWLDMQRGQCHRYRGMATSRRPPVVCRRRRRRLWASQCTRQCTRHYSQRCPNRNSTRMATRSSRRGSPSPRTNRSMRWLRSSGSTGSTHPAVPMP